MADNRSSEIEQGQQDAAALLGVPKGHRVVDEKIIKTWLEENLDASESF